MFNSHKHKRIMYYRIYYWRNLKYLKLSQWTFLNFYLYFFYFLNHQKYLLIYLLVLIQRSPPAPPSPSHENHHLIGMHRKLGERKVS